MPENDVADLVQDVYSILVEKLPQFQYQSSKRFRGWLWTILLNKRREWIRHRQPTALEAQMVTEVAVSPAIEKVIQIEYQHYLVAKTTELIRPEFQAKTWRAFHDCVLKDRAISEVARELEMSENAVYIAKCRVLRRLLQELEGLLEVE